MKKLIKACGIVLIVSAIVLFALAGLIEEEARPRKVSTGVVINGTYKEINSGYIGGNAKTVNDMGWLKGISVMAGIAGAGAIIGSAAIKEEKEPEY